MKRVELIEAALQMCTGHDELRKAMNYVCTVEDRTYATDGRVMLTVDNALMEGKVFCVPEGEGRYPNVKAVYDLRDYRHVSMLPAMSMPIFDEADRKTVHLVCIEGMMFQRKFYDVLRTLTSILGVKAWDIMLRQDNARVNGMVLTADDGKIGVLIMPNFCGDYDVLIDTQDAVQDETVDYDLGIQNFRRMEQLRKKKDREDRLKRQGNIWTFTVAKYATMYVEAKDEEEAKAIAHDQCGMVDDSAFDDSEIGVDSWEPGGCTRRRSEFNDGDSIFTTDGEVDVDDYAYFDDEDDDDW